MSRPFIEASEEQDRGAAVGWPRWAGAWLALLIAGSHGCALSSPDPGPSPPQRWCGDAVCSSWESPSSCPTDCAPPVRCGDGICAAGESCASCAVDCASACVDPCPAADLGARLPLHLQETTSGGAASAGQATCGHGAIGPLRRYRLDDLPAGRYRVSATGGFDIVIDARRLMCGGQEVGCEATTRGSVATFVMTFEVPQTVIIEVSGLAGGVGEFSLDVTSEPQCGDLVCQDETCLSCPTDCGRCPPPVACGDGVCAAGQESCASCLSDCGACPVPRCGDGTCQAGESCGSCPADCGDCGPSCGDGTCDPGETCGACPFDCGACAPSCGNAWCGFGEDCRSCPFDCGACAPTCGDGVCDPGEDCDGCPFDCGAC